DIGTLAQAAALLKTMLKRGRASRTLDIAGLDSLDTPGALLLCGLRDQGITLVGVRDEHRALLDLVYGLELKPLPKMPAVPRWRQLVIQLGKGSHDARRDVVDLTTFVGRVASWTFQALIHPSRLRPA